MKLTGRTDYAGARYAELFPNVIPTGVLEQFRQVATTGVPADFIRWYEGEGMHHWFRFIVSKTDDLLIVTTEGHYRPQTGRRRSGTNSTELTGCTK